MPEIYTSSHCVEISFDKLVYLAILGGNSLSSKVHLRLKHFGPGVIKLISDPYVAAWFTEHFPQGLPPKQPNGTQPNVKSIARHAKATFRVNGPLLNCFADYVEREYQPQSEDTFVQVNYQTVIQTPATTENEWLSE
jgi:hypothetical protein